MWSIILLEGLGLAWTQEAASRQADVNCINWIPFGTRLDASATVAT